MTPQDVSDARAAAAALKAFGEKTRRRVTKRIDPAQVQLSDVRVEDDVDEDGGPIQRTTVTPMRLRLTADELRAVLVDATADDSSVRP